MPEPREKPKMEKPKEKSPSALSPKQAARVLSSKYERQLEQRVPGEENETEYATGQVEHASRRVTEDVAGGVRRVHDGRRKAKAQWKSAGQDTDPGATEQPEGAEHPNAPKEQPTAEDGQNAADSSKTRRQANSRKKAPDASRPGRQTGPSPGTSVPKSTGTGGKQSSTAKGTWQASDSAPAVPRREATPKERPRATAATLKTRENFGATAKVSGKADAAGKKLRRSKAAAQTISRTRRNAQRQTARQMVTQALKTAKTATNLMKKAAVAVTKAVAKLIISLVGITGGGLLLVVLIMVFVVSAIGNSPFGIFFTSESSADTVSVSEAVSTVNMAYNAKLEELQDGGYDSVVINGQAADWPDILAVFAAKTAGAEDGVDVATLDADRVQRLTDVFWAMTAITSEVETINHPGSGEDDPGWTEYILHISITAKTADDMRTQYNFTEYQNSALDELLAERDALAELIGSLTITDADVSAILDALPDDLSPERRAAVETALTLVGKVNYFWGGKSSAIGWDSRWGVVYKVTAPGSSTTGTYRPYGLDCSGYVDWTFNNSLDYVIGHGGGTYTQHAHCRDILSAEALPGDLAFYPDDSHVGIVVGRSDTGGILVAHCSSGSNNVVVTDCAASGFTAIGRPDIFD